MTTTKLVTLLTAKEVAARLGVSPKTVYDHGSAGTLPATYILDKQPRWHPLVVEGAIAGASADVLGKVHAAVGRNEEEDDVRALWAAPSAKVIAITRARRIGRKTAKAKTTTTDKPPPSAA